MNILVFDIETVPDTATAKRLYQLDGLADADIARAMGMRQVQKTGNSDFLPLHLHRIVAISVVRQSGDNFLARSLGGEDACEAELIKSFYGIIDRSSPTLVSWNGAGFDLPVLHYRSLLHQVTAHRYWESGAEERDFRYNNYLNRYHWRHIDLMDVLAGFSPRAFAPLDEIAVMLGFPGKQGLRGDQVWAAYLAGEIRQIRNYCEIDALNTLLVYLNWEVVRGALTRQHLAQQITRLKEWLRQSGQRHFLDFLQTWEQTTPPNHA